MRNGGLLMSKLHKKMVALGNLSEHSYDSIVAACGEPKEKKSCTFSDIGEGFRAHLERRHLYPDPQLQL